MSENGDCSANHARTPAYVSYDTFANFIGRLAETAVPPHMDKTLMSNMSGAVQSHLFSALRFLGLVSGKNDKVAPELNRLVATRGTDEWGNALREILDSAYSDIVSEVDITSASAKALDNAFRARGLDGSMLDRAVRFYLKAMKDAGVEYSPHFGKRRPRSAAKRGGKSKKKNIEKGKARSGPGSSEDASNDGTPDPSGVPKGMIRIPIPIGGDADSYILIRQDITTQQFPMVKAVMAVVEAMAAQNSAEKE